MRVDSKMWGELRPEEIESFFSSLGRSMQNMANKSILAVLYKVGAGDGVKFAGFTIITDVKLTKAELLKIIQALPEVPKGTEWCEDQ